MSTLIKKTNEITVTDITEEAKGILSNAMKAFTSPEYKKQAYIQKQRWFWMDNGMNEVDAQTQAIEDYEWTL